MKKKPERWIALSVILCAVTLMLLLGLVLGKFQLPTIQRQLTVDFSNITGINLNSPVKFAGAQVGRVKKIHVLARKDQISSDHFVYCVQVVLEVDPQLELGNDLKISIKQDGLLGSRFIALIPGHPEAEPLDDKKIWLGDNPVELDDLLPLAQTLLAGFAPTVEHLNSISNKLDAQLPQIMTDLDSLLNGGSGLIGSVNTVEGKMELTKILRNMAIISDNLKVVTTQAKGITSTLGEKPWRLLWGGSPTKLPTEDEILQANRALPVLTPEMTESQAQKVKPKSP